jgi:hypothetical protein
LPVIALSGSTVRNVRSRVVGAGSHVDESGVGAGVLGVVTERCGRGAFARWGAVGAVDTFAGDCPCGRSQEACGALLVVVEIGDRAAV